MNDFLNQLQQTLTDSACNRAVTENGALGYKTTGKALVDLNFATSSLRGASEEEIERKFSAACAEGVDTAIVWLFFARDARQGMGERRLFRVCMRYLAREFPYKVRKVLPLVAEYGRWDDLWCLLGTSVQGDVFALIKDRLTEDMRALREGGNVSLLAKWMPSLNTSSAETRKEAERIRAFLHISPRRYRIMLSALRKHLNVIERKMSAGQWDKITYSAVPSRANLIYNDAFLRHDEERRREYLGKLEKGEEKINASVLFPHDIVHRYVLGHGWNVSLKEIDPALEGMWKALPNTVGEKGGGTLVVADGSGSMTSTVGNTDVRAIEVSNALAVYFAERLSGPYKDRFITFSSKPELVSLGGSTTLLGKLKTAFAHNDCTNTNLEAVFDLILATAVQNRLRQEEIPANVLVISDMEFDSACTACPNQTLFDHIAQKYARYGYKLPRLVFWNVCNRTGAIPMKENDLGVALVSGFSPNVAKMVMSGALDPLGALMETLNGERYEPVRRALA